MTNVVIASAARTAVGSFSGSFANTPAHDLGATVLEALVERAGIEHLHQHFPVVGVEKPEEAGVRRIDDFVADPGGSFKVSPAHLDLEATLVPET